MKAGAQIALATAQQNGRSAKTRGKTALAPHPGPARAAAPRLPSHPAPATARGPESGAFSRILEQKGAERPAPADRALLDLPAAARLFHGESLPETARLEKELKDILDDPRLTARQKAARLKGLLSEAREQASAELPGDGMSHLRLTDMKRAAEPQTSVPAVAARADSPEKAQESRVFVWDLRKKPEEKQAAGQQAGQAGGKTAPAADREPAGLASVPRGGEREGHAQARPARAPEPSAHAAPQTPLERLREMAGSELSRATGIILRDGGSGEIRLVLKPESLGSVRVRLNLTDTVIEGKIIVDNPAVKHVLEGSIDSLARALTADGFQTASLQVSVGGGDGKPARDDREAPALRRVESAKGFSGTVPDAVNASWGELLVNLFA